MREKILTFIEKNSRIDLKELAIILGVDEMPGRRSPWKLSEKRPSPQNTGPGAPRPARWNGYPRQSGAAH